MSLDKQDRVVVVEIRYLMTGQKASDNEICEVTHTASSFEKAEDWIRENGNWMDGEAYTAAWWVAHEWIVDKDLGGTNNLRYYSLNGVQVDDLYEIKKDAS